MDNRPQQKEYRIMTVAYLAAAAFVVSSMVLYPAQAFEASMQGLKLWWELAFPALLPFFILCEIVTAYGLAQAAGTLLEPAARRLIGLSGTAGWPIAAGMLAGSPAGAEAAVKLYKAQALPREEAQRLVAVSHFANPVLIYTIIAVVFLREPALGPFLLAVHYGSALLCALAIRPFGRKPAAPGTLGEHGTHGARAARRPGRLRLRHAPFAEMAAALRGQRRRDGRSFGKVLGDAVTDSLQKLFMIGGTIMILSVMLQLLRASGALPPALQPFAAGIAEVHLGAHAASRLAHWPMAGILAALGGVLGWGGVAVHLQVRALLHGTGIRYLPFLLVRALHAGLAAAISCLTWPAYRDRFVGARPAVSAAAAPLDAAAAEPSLWGAYLQGPLLLPVLALLALAWGLDAAAKQTGRGKRLRRGP